MRTPALRRRALLMSAILVIGTAVAPAADEDAATSSRPPADDSSPAFHLRYKFVPNQTVHAEVVHKTTISVQKGSASETTAHESRSNRHFRVVAVDGRGAAILEPVVDRVRMTVRFGGHPAITYDSDSGDPPPRQFRGVDTTIGKPLVQMKIAANGALLETLRLGSGQRRASDTADEASTPDNDPSQNFLVVFPDKPVRVGESWSDRGLKARLEVAPKLRQDFEILRRYELVAVEGHLATISLKTVPLRAVREPELQAQLVQYLLSGTITFDLERGQIVARKLTVDDQVVGFSGSESLLHVKSERTEKTVSAAETRKQAAKHKPSNKQ